MSHLLARPPCRAGHSAWLAQLFRTNTHIQNVMLVYAKCKLLERTWQNDIRHSIWCYRIGECYSQSCQTLSSREYSGANLIALNVNKSNRWTIVGIWFNRWNLNFFRGPLQVFSHQRDFRYILSFHVLYLPMHAVVLNVWNPLLQEHL